MFGKRTIPVFVSCMILASCFGGEITDGDDWDPKRFDERDEQSGFEELGDAILLIGGLLLVLFVELDNAEIKK